MLNLESVFSRTSSSLSEKAHTTKLCRAALLVRIGIDKTLSRRPFGANRYRQNLVAPPFRVKSVSTKLCRAELKGLICIYYSFIHLSTSHQRLTTMNFH